MVVAQGASKVTILIEMIEDRDDARLPALAREALGSLVEQLRMAQTQILDLEKQLKAWHRTNEASRRLEAIPGVGVITATASRRYMTLESIAPLSDGVPITLPTVAA